ncbi:MAG: hypothetical protein GF307_14330 [candidate division Zixibacteria bacterium]|nr:hypothetical protein [candidate division Zixibacteria bacterium]
MRRCTLILLTAIIMVLNGISAFAEIENWGNFGRPFSTTRIIDVSSGYDGRLRCIFAAVESDSGFLWKSFDGGLTWDRSHYVTDHWHNRVVVKKNRPYYVWTLVPSNSGNIDYIAGPWYSDDGGYSWLLMNYGLEDSKILHALAVDQTSPRLIVAYVGCEGNAANEGDLLFKTSDGGITWYKSQKGLPDTFGTVYDIVVGEDNPDVIYCIFEGSSGSGVYQSTNAGANWSKIEVTPGSDSLETAMAIGIGNTDSRFEVERRPNEIWVVEKEPVAGRVWWVTDTDNPDSAVEISPRGLLVNSVCGQAASLLSKIR